MSNKKVLIGVIASAILGTIVGICVGTKFYSPAKSIIDSLVDSFSMSPLGHNPVADEFEQQSQVPTLNLSDFTQFEIDMIYKEAKENNVPEQYWPVLFAINKAEGNTKGREFGVLSERCLRLCREDPDNSFEIQAGHCAWEIRERALDYKAISSDLNRQGRKIMPFIDYFGAIYCPTKGTLSKLERELNKNWIPNVKKWVKKIKDET